MDFEIGIRHQRGGTIVEPRGDVDIYTCSLLRDAIQKAFGEGDGPVAVDLAAVDFIDSTGLGVLVGGLKRAKAVRRAFVVICDQELTLRIFRVTGLDKVLEIRPSLESLEGLAESA